MRLVPSYLALACAAVALLALDRTGTLHPGPSDVVQLLLCAAVVACARRTWWVPAASALALALVGAPLTSCHPLVQGMLLVCVAPVALVIMRGLRGAPQWAPVQRRHRGDEVDPSLPSVVATPASSSSTPQLPLDTSPLDDDPAGHQMPELDDEDDAAQDKLWLDTRPGPGLEEDEDGSRWRVLGDGTRRRTRDALPLVPRHGGRIEHLGPLTVLHPAEADPSGAVTAPCSPAVQCLRAALLEALRGRDAVLSLGAHAWPDRVTGDTVDAIVELGGTTFLLEAPQHDARNHLMVNGEAISRCLERWRAASPGREVLFRVVAPRGGIAPASRRDDAWVPVVSLDELVAELAARPSRRERHLGMASGM